MATVFKMLTRWDEVYDQLVKFPVTVFWKLQTVIGHVRPRDQSNSIEAELSEVDAHGKSSFRSEDQYTKV